MSDNFLYPPSFSPPKKSISPLGNYISSSGAGLDDRLETGSVITMTSDERVQIYVPSPQGTPYNTIHPGQQQAMQLVQQQRPQSHPPPSSSSSSSQQGQIARVGILAGTDSSRSVTPIKASGATPQHQLLPAEEASLSATQETSLEMVRISIRSSSASSASSSYRFHSSSTTAAAAAAASNSGGGDSSVTVHKPAAAAAPVSSGERTMAEDLPSLPRDPEEEDQPPVSLSHITLEDNDGSQGQK